MIPQRRRRTPIQSVLANIAIGLVTSLLGGASVWVWERFKRTRAENRRAEFFGVRPGQRCLIVLGSKYDAPGTAHYRDVRAITELTLLVGDLGCHVIIVPGDFRGGNGDRTEFCVGGPIGGANPRTGGHLAAHLPGVTIHPHSGTSSDSMAIQVGREKFLFDPGNDEYALVAKFLPSESQCPVFLIAGQTAMGNLAAVNFLRREHAQVAKILPSIKRFSIIIKVSDIETYDFHRAELHREVTTAAFGD
ncbi:hypothetical protein H181DRAFT_03641 [Streptomyces sp. WMMB 714]|nr:hypothetical protein H181DRAFT_03641 [Streptomyces sp. WMMB 714]